MSTGLTAEELDFLRRFLAFEDAKEQHMKDFPEWWASQEPYDQEATDPATRRWSDISASGFGLGTDAVVEVVRGIISRADAPCAIHEDCSAHPELAQACTKARNAA